MEAFDTFVAENPGASFEDYNKEITKRMANIKTAAGKATTPLGRAGNATWLAKNAPLAEQQMRTSMASIVSGQELTKSRLLIKKFVEDMNEEGLRAHYAQMVEADFYNPEIAAVELELHVDTINEAKKKLFEEQVNEAITGQYQTIIENGGTEVDARAPIDKAVKAGIVSAESKESLYSSLSSYTNQINDNEQIKDTVVTRDFADKAQKNELNLDDVFAEFPSDEAGDVAARDHWRKILKKSQKPDKLPKKTTTDGMEEVMDLLTGIPKGEITSKVAIEDLTTLHYVKKDISEKTLQWALARVDKPYPTHITKQLQSTLLATEKQINFFWETAGEAKEIRAAQDAIMQNVSDDLLDWVDGEIAKDRLPSPKEIYQKAAEFTVGAREVERNEGINTLVQRDQEALDWANANPNDPRSARIKIKLGVK